MKRLHSEHELLSDLLAHTTALQAWADVLARLATQPGMTMPAVGISSRRIAERAAEVARMTHELAGDHTGLLLPASSPLLGRISAGSTVRDTRVSAFLRRGRRAW